MIKWKGIRPPGATPPSHGDGDGGDRSSPDDVQQLLREWRQQVIRQKAAANQRRLLTSAVHPSSLDEIKAVTRIGRLRLLRKAGRTK
jgi:hypothetical protein